MTRNESFSIASSSSVAWYAGTFIPIKNTKNLEDLLKLNTKTFCMLINDQTIINVKSKQLNKEDFLQLIENLYMKLLIKTIILLLV